MMTRIFRLPQVRFGMDNNNAPRQQAQPQPAQAQRGPDIEAPRPLGPRRGGMRDIFEGMRQEDVAQIRGQQPEQQRAPFH
jgi:hypothetical protein